MERGKSAPVGRSCREWLGALVWVLAAMGCLGQPSAKERSSVTGIAPNAAHQPAWGAVSRRLDLSREDGGFWWADDSPSPGTSTVGWLIPSPPSAPSPESGLTGGTK